MFSSPITQRVRDRQFSLLKYGCYEVMRMRKLLPDNIFTTNRNEGLSSLPIDHAISKKMQGVKECLMRGFLEEFVIVVSECREKDDTAIELYQWRISSTSLSVDYRAGEQVINCFELLSDDLPTAERARVVVQSIRKLLSSPTIKPLPDKSYFSFRIKYTDEADSIGYSPSHFTDRFSSVNSSDGMVYFPVFSLSTGVSMVFCSKLISDNDPKLTLKEFPAPIEKVIIDLSGSFVTSDHQSIEFARDEDNGLTPPKSLNKVSSPHLYSKLSISDPSEVLHNTATSTNGLGYETEECPSSMIAIRNSGPFDAISDYSVESISPMRISRSGRSLASKAPYEALDQRSRRQRR